MNLFAENVRKIRESFGMTQNEFAGKIGITTARLGAWEEGRCHPLPNAVKPLCDAIGYHGYYRILFDRMMEPITPVSLKGNGFTIHERSTTDLKYYACETNPFYMVYRTAEGKWGIEVGGKDSMIQYTLMFIHQIKDHYFAYLGEEMAGFNQSFQQ